MKLVLLFFCGIFIFLVLAVILIILSSIKLNVKKCYLSNIERGKKKAGIDKEFQIYAEFYLLGLIKIFKVKITKDLLEKLKVKNDIASIENDIKAIKSVNIIEIIKHLKLKIEEVKIYLNFGTESVMLTVYLVAIISSIIRNNICKNKS